MGKVEGGSFGGERDGVEGGRCRAGDTGIIEGTEYFVFERDLRVVSGAALRGQGRTASNGDRTGL